MPRFRVDLQLSDGDHSILSSVLPQYEICELVTRALVVCALVTKHDKLLVVVSRKDLVDPQLMIRLRSALVLTALISAPWLVAEPHLIRGEPFLVSWIRYMVSEPISPVHMTQ